MGEIPRFQNLLAFDRALSWSSADAPELKHVDLPGGLVDVETAMNQIAAITMVNFAAHQIREKQLPLLKLGEWQAQITLPAIARRSS